MNLPTLSFDAPKTVFPLLAVLVGPTGAGKSTLVGTLGVPTLYFHTASESHGPRAARTINPKIAPICIDGDAAKTPDEHFEGLLAMLADVKGMKAQKVGAIVLDGWAELESLLMTTTAMKNFCRTKDGTHNTFKEGDFILLKFREIRKALQIIQDNGMHVITTLLGILTSQPDDLNGYSLSPRLKGYNTAEFVLSLFPDILIPARLVNKDGKSEFALLYHATISRSQTKEDGSMKVAAFTPRITGTLITAWPQKSSADLSKMLEFRDKLMNGGGK